MSVALGGASNSLKTATWSARSSDSAPYDFGDENPTESVKVMEFEALEDRKLRGMLTNLISPAEAANDQIEYGAQLGWTSRLQVPGSANSQNIDENDSNVLLWHYNQVRKSHDGNTGDSAGPPHGNDHPQVTWFPEPYIDWPQGRVLNQVAHFSAAPDIILQSIIYYEEV